MIARAGIFRSAVRAATRAAEAYSKAAAARPFMTAAATSGTLMIAGDAFAQALERKSAEDAGREVPEHDWSRSVVMASWGLTVLPAVWAPWYTALDGLFARVPALARLGGFRGALAKAVFTALTIAPVSNGFFFAYSTAVERTVDRVTSALADDDATRLADVLPFASILPFAVDAAVEPTMAAATTAHPVPLPSAVVRTRVTHCTVDADDDDGADDVPLLAAIQNKIVAEMPGTVAGSFSVWVPANTLAWAVIPPAFRFPVLSSLSVCWNAYLSLAQHRDG